MSRGWVSGLYATDAKRLVPFSDVAHDRIRELEDKIKSQADEIGRLYKEVCKLRAEKAAPTINSEGVYYRMAKSLWYAIDKDAVCALYDKGYCVDVVQSRALAEIRRLKDAAIKADKARIVLGDAPST